MKKHMHSFTLLLSLILLTASACQDTADRTVPASTDTHASGKVEDTAEAAASFDVPESVDFGGREVVIYVVDEDVTHAYIEDFASETGDFMNDQIYTRNRMTEEYLDVKLTIETVKGTDTFNGVQKDSMSGDSRYDLVNTHILNSVASLVTEGLITDLGNLDYVDFTKPWWYSDFVHTMSIKGKNFYAMGDLIAPNARVMVFNKHMMEEYQLPDIYEAVENGKWTLDQLALYTKDITHDADGDGVLDEKDIYALSDFANTGLGTSFVHAAGERFIVSDGNSYEMTLGSEKMHTILTKLNDCIYMDIAAKKPSAQIDNTVFGEGRALFGSQVLLKLQILRDYDTEFGIIPFPKYDESQETYYSSAWNGLVCVPATAKDYALCGALLETMSYFSSSTLIPAYYEKLLDGKFSRDDESTRMLDIIFDGLVFDIGLCYDNFISYYASVGQLLNSNSTDIASFFEKNKNNWQAHYDALFDSVK